jgi:hypothetical protein
MTKIGIVACLHGDEQFGLRVTTALKGQGDIVCVVANPQAVHAKKRYVHDDLNRCFNGSGHPYEQSRVTAILKALQGCDYVIDIHNTTTSVKNALIVANLGPKTRSIITAHPGRYIAHMPPLFAKKALIGQFPDGAVSLEYSFEYANTPRALEEVLSTVQQLQTPHPHKKRQRTILHIEKTIARDVSLPAKDNNYAYIETLGGYGFLVGENAYEGIHQGFLAARKEIMIL